MIKLLQNNYVNTGNRCNSGGTAREMSQVIYKSIHDEFVNMLIQNQMPLTLIVDGSGVTNLNLKSIFIKVR